jgi:hypothetical protein
MEAAILRHLAGRNVYVESAGVRPDSADAFAAAVMEEIGIDISRTRPRCASCTTPLRPDNHAAGPTTALELTRTMAVRWNTGRPSTPR